MRVSLLLVPLAAAAAVAPVPANSIRKPVVGVSKVTRRSLILGTAAALLAPAARAEPPVKAEVPVKTTDYKGFNLFGEGSAERCENGQGAACEKLAEGSDLSMLCHRARTPV